MPLAVCLALLDSLVCLIEYKRHEVSNELHGIRLFQHRRERLVKHHVGLTIRPFDQTLWTHLCERSDPLLLILGEATLLDDCPLARPRPCLFSSRNAAVLPARKPVSVTLTPSSEDGLLDGLLQLRGFQVLVSCTIFLYPFCVIVSSTLK